MGETKGLNNEHVMREIETRCVENKDKTNGKLKVDR
jgi:hypothetical protein